MKFKTFFAACIVASALKVQAATVLYATDFNAPTYTNGVINPSVGSDTTTAGQGGWLGTSNTATGSNNITVSSGTVPLTTSGQDIRHTFASSGVGSYYLEADITVSAAQATGDYFLHLGDGGASNFYARTYIKSSGAGFVMALGTGSGTATYGTTVLAFGTTYTILVRYDLISGLANDTGALFVNPLTEDGSGDTAYVAATNIGTDASAIGGVYLRQGTAGSSATLTIDNLTVSSIPEPVSAMLGALGLLAILRRRR